MKLFLVHAGFYDNEIGIYELHTNFMVAAADITVAKKVVKEKEIFLKKNMHIDAVQEIEIIDGYRITLTKNTEDISKTIDYDYTQIKKLA